MHAAAWALTTLACVLALALAVGPASPASAWADGGCLAQARFTVTLRQAHGRLPNLVVPVDHLYAGADIPSPIRVPFDVKTGTGIRSIEIGKVLGKGGFGKVYEAVVTDAKGTRRTVAWKEVEKEIPMQLESEGMELQRVAARRSRYVVPVHARVELTSLGVGGTPQVRRHGYVMELAGENARSLVAPKGALSLWIPTAKGGALKQGAEPLLRTLRGLARLTVDTHRALADLASAGIVHRDIKAANIVIFGGKENTLAEVMEGTARFGLIDFGLTAPKGWSHPEGSLQGTPPFMAPELWAGSPGAHPAADAYAVSQILAQALLGVPIGKPKGRFYVKGAADRLFLSPERVHKGLSSLRRRLESAGADDEGLAIFDELAAITVAGLQPEPLVRGIGLKPKVETLRRRFQPEEQP